MTQPPKQITLIVLLTATTLLLTGVAVFTAMKLKESGTDPVVPTVPESEPQAAPPTTNTCTETGGIWDAATGFCDCGIGLHWDDAADSCLADNECALSFVVPTATGTPLPTNTPVPPEDTPTPGPEDTPTPEPAATNTPAPGATNTPIPTVTIGPLPEAGINLPLTLGIGGGFLLTIIGGLLLLL